MRHVTVNALAVVAGTFNGMPYSMGGMRPPTVRTTRACTYWPMRGDESVFDVHAALALVGSDVLPEWPDCPTCLVLLAAALQREPDPLEAARKEVVNGR